MTRCPSASRPAHQGRSSWVSLFLAITLAGCNKLLDTLPDLASCASSLDARPFAATRGERFTGNVEETTARCRGGTRATGHRGEPWVDFTHYWAAGDATSRHWLGTKNIRGINGALIDLEYARVELIRFNLFDNSGTWPRYVSGDSAVEGPAIRQWPEMRLPPAHPAFAAVGGAGDQACTGELVRFRTLTGICNDLRNPLMGSTGTLFARNVEFESTFPDEAGDSLARNRHGGRVSLTSPDPRLVSQRLFTRLQGDPGRCNDGAGPTGDPAATRCDYLKAPFFNVLAAYWIQFMTHDWFSHLDEGRNASSQTVLGCLERDDVMPRCRTMDSVGRALVADSSSPARYATPSGDRLARAPRTFRNTNTAWWDASQLYGYDERSRVRVKRDPSDPARLLMVRQGRDDQGYLPPLGDVDPMHPEWAGQEATGFPDNWSIGLSLLHTVFAREHNQFVAAFRRQAAATPAADCGIRRPGRAAAPVPYRDVTADELFEVARLVVAAEIAKIHTIEWTTQLLYNEPLYKAMNANWNGLVDDDNMVGSALARVVASLGASSKGSRAASWFSVLAAGAGIVGTGSQRPDWSIDSTQHLNGGVNHFGSPFNFPEEFVTVYRLHPLIPDVLEVRQLAAPNAVTTHVPTVATFRGKATPLMRAHGAADWALSLGRQRLGLLTLQNSPRFLQHLQVSRAPGAGTLDVMALDLLRDRERGVPRYNEFRRQYGLRHVRSFEDFVDVRLAATAPERLRQESIVQAMREVYGQHRCDQRKAISLALRNPDGSAITDCLGFPDGTIVDNVEDLDVVVGYLAEFTRPHGFAISETQFLVFVLNASRRLFSDRFFTSSYRPEIYSTLGMSWVDQGGPAPMQEPGEDNGHAKQPVSTFKRVLLRTVPELAGELADVRNVFDPWARDRGAYYSLDWTPRAGARADASFRRE